ncbi:hypothetical protein NPX13_g3499 [Xylaria arbuscula]|uniref:AB hydrolase-1 domain-containing protein n=1 Tax=Xylaria arbuscula TaxID=114810 RepID=A0A9W8NH67_9PEZI|nr:hypothetical protein NPX13_g3499 [Xylaria arbuscula]
MGGAIQYEYDLEVLVDPVKNADLDIVFISATRTKGLQNWTATADGNDVVWPRDFLGTDIPRARISSYAYHISDWKEYDEHAKDLPVKLAELRAGDTQPAPIVLVAHSVSGLVTAKVMSEETNIAQHVQGLAFFATPFQDPDGDAPVSTLNAIIAKRCGYSDDKTTREAYVLQDLFENVSRQNTAIDVAVFTEFFGDTAVRNNLSLPVVSQVDNLQLVDDDIVGKPKEKYSVQSLPGEHDDICKFGSRKGVYGVVRRALQRLRGNPFNNRGTVTYWSGGAGTINFYQD